LAVPGPNSWDKAAPLIGAIAQNQTTLSPTTINWTTDTPTLGFVTWGTTSGARFGWSAIESSYQTSHSLALSDLPAGKTIYFVVLEKDQAGNQTLSPEHIINP
jgi:hypothetical protein